MDLKIIGKPGLQTSEGTKKKDSEASSTWILVATEEARWSNTKENLSKSSAEVGMTRKGKCESFKTDMVDGFVYRI